MNQIRDQSYPFQQNVPRAQSFINDPTARNQMMRETPGFLASQEFAERAQQRRNSATGNLNTGYGDTLTADVLGRNASQWDNQLFNQLSQASGMGFNNVASQAQLGTGFLPAAFNMQTGADMTMGNAIGNVLQSPAANSI